MSEESEKTELNRIPDEKGRMIFPPGVSGNPAGRPKGSISVVSAIKAKLQECPEGKEKTYLHYLVEKIMKKAVIDDDVSMIKDIIDRVDGKPKQPLVGGGEDDAPVSLLVEFINAKDKDTNTGGISETV